MKTPIAQKKVLIVTPYFYPNIEWGGPITVTWNLTQLLVKKGYKIEVLTTDVSGSTNKIKTYHYSNSGLKIIYAKSLFPVLSWKFRVFLSIDQVIKGVKQIPKFDIVHFNDMYILQNLVLAFFCRKNNIPYVITPHGNLSFVKERGKGFMKRMFYLLLGKNYLENAAKIIAVSEAENNYIDKAFPKLSEKTIYVPQTVLGERFKKIDIKSKYNIPDENKVILFIGRIYALKGVNELLLGFMNYLKNVSKSASLILAGPDAGGLGEIKQILNKFGQLKGKVIFTGEVAGDLKYSLLSQCDALCLFSKSESMPITILEAAYFGKPVLCSKECNVQDLVKSGGAIISTREAYDISNNLKILLSSKESLEKMGKESREWFYKNHNPEQILNKYKKIYDNN